MNYLDYLKKKKDENDNSQSNTTTGNTSNNKSDSLLDAINGKNGNNDYLDYLNSQPVLGQEEEETQALHDMGNGEDVLSRWYDSASNATSKAYYENQNTAFDSLKNRADTISKYYQTADALKGSAKQFYDKYGYTDDSSDMQSAISDLNIAEEDAKTNAKEIQNAMSDFDTEQEYKSAVAQAEEDAKTSDDLQKEYDELKKEYDVESKKSFDKESYSDSEIAEYYNNINAKAEQLDNLQRKIDQKKELENEKKYYTDFRKQNPKVAKTLDAYYDMQSYEEEHSKDALDTYNKEALKEKLKKGKLPTDSLYTDEEKKAIETNFNSLKTLDGWNVDQIYKYYKRAKDREKAEKENKNIKDFADKHPIASTAISTLNMIPSAFESSPKQVASVVDKWTGGDGYYNPEESAVYQNNLLQQEVASNIDNPFLQGVYQQGVSLVDNAIRMGIAYANPAVGLSMMGAEVATQGFDDTIENGGSVEQALATGLTYAGVEVLTEGVSLGKLKAFKNGGVKEFKSILKNAGKQILTEASEEVSATLLDSVADEIINGSLSQLETEYDKYIDSGMSETEAGQAVMLNYGGQIIQDAIGGALMGGISGTAVNTSQYRRNIKAGKSISSLDNIDTVKNLAKHYGLNDSVTDYENNPTDARLGALQSEAYEKATESMPSEKELKKVIKKANLASDENVVAKKLTSGENLTNDDLEKIKKSENLKSLLANDVVNQAKSARFNQQSALLSADTKLFTPSLIEFNSEKSDADANLNNAETLNKFLSENAKNMTINTDTVNKMKDAYNGLEDKIEPDTFAMEYARFFNQGVRAVAFQSLNSTVSQLPYNVQVSAYEDGLNKYTTALKAGNALSKLQQEWKDKTNGYAKGTVDNSALEGIKLNDEQKASVDYISGYANHGLNVKFYASRADENGVYIDDNGGYDSLTNTIMIDINAKKETINDVISKGAMMSTFGHELSHLAEHAPTEYAELSKAIQDAVGADTFNDAVDKHYSILEERNSDKWQKMSEDKKQIYATREAVAEFSSDLVNQAKILERMSKENPSVGKKFINFIKKVISKIKSILKDNRGMTDEARLLANNLASNAEKLQSIVDKYEKAVIEGLKNQNAKVHTNKSSVKENNAKTQSNTRTGDFLTERERTLVATHNISSQNLMNLINDFDGAGLPVPSIAIEKADSVHDDFGDVTLLFNKDTIDPQNNSNNNVYNRDAWTSTFPQTEYKINVEGLKAIAKKLDLSEYYLESNIFNTNDLNGIKRKFLNDRYVRKAFVEENNIEVTPVAYEKKPKFSFFANPTVKSFIENNNCTFDRLVNDKEFRDAFLKVAKESIRLRIALRQVERFENTLNDCAKSKDVYSDSKESIEYCIEYAKGNAKKEVTEHSYDEGIENAINEHKAEFEKYIDNMLSESGVIGDKYIVRDDVDLYNNDGSRKSFEQTHYDYNIDNVVKAMKVGKSAISNSFFGGIEYAKTISAKNLNSIEEIKNNEHKLQQLSPEEIETQRENISNLLAPIIKEIADSSKYSNGEFDDGYTEASDSVVDAFRRYNTIDGVYKYLKQYYGNLKKSTVNKLFKARDEIAEMPVRYFEAKPHRVVGFDEVMAVVIPVDADEKLKSALKKMDIPMYEYADESQRADATHKAINTEYTDKSGVTYDNIQFSSNRGDFLSDKEVDNQYSQAVKNNNIETAQRLVDEKAEEVFRNSEVRDKNGDLLPVYHARNNNFTIFNKSKSGDNTYKNATDWAAGATSNLGFWFNDSDLKNEMGTQGETLKSYLNIENAWHGTLDDVIETIRSFSTNEELSEEKYYNNDYSQLKEYAQNFVDELTANGYDGMILHDTEFGGFSYVAFNSNQIKSADAITYDNNGEVIPLSERFNSSEEDIRYNMRGGDFLSNREALAQALETTALNASERNTVKTYQQGLEQMNKLNDKLNEIDDKIKAINTKDNISKSDKAEIASLKKVKAETEEKIVNKDKSLLKLESTEAMRNILKYETSKKIARVREQKNERIAEIRKQETQKRKDAVAKLRKQKNDKIDDIILKNREKRKADAEKRKDNQDWSHSISEIKKYSKKLLDAVLHPTEKMYIPYGLNEPIKSITSTLLDSINLDNDTKMSDKLRKLSQQLEQVNQSDEHYGDFYNAYSKEIIEEIKGFADYLEERLEGIKIKKQTQGESLIEGLTHEEAKEIEQIVKDVYNATRDAVKQIGRQDAITNYESGLRIINQTRELGDVKLNVMDSLLDQVLSPMRLMAKYTGYNADAELMYHINALNEGTEKYNMFKMLAEKPLNDFIKENPKEYESFKNDVIEIKYRDNKNVAQTVKMTKSQGLQILMSWTREHTEGSHLDHMERGGVTLLDAEQMSKGNYEKAFAQRKTIRGINLSFISAVQSQMGEFENHYRELAETLFNEVSNAYINDTSAILLHRDIATEKYYIPFAVNKDFLSTEIDGLKYDATIVNKGMLKTTKRNAPQALNIAGLDSVISKHIRDVGQYYGYAVPIRNLNKALNVKMFDTNENGNKIATDSVRNALRETFNSDKPIQFIEQVMTDLQTSRKSNSQTEKAINKIVRAVRDNMITSALKGSVSVVIKQGASLYTASSILSMRSVSVGAVKGIQQIARKGGWKQLTDEIDAHTAGHYMRRIGLSSMEIEAMKDSWLGKKLPTALNPAKWIQGTDCITTALHWVATKEEVSRLYKEQGKADQIGSDEYFDEVTKLYDQILEETQPMYDSLHRGEIQKNSNELLKSVFMFKTQPLQNTGILYDAIMDYQANKDNAELRDAKKQKLAKAVSSQMVSALTFVAMTFIASLALHKPERYKDENDEVTLSSVLKRLGIDWAETGFSVLVPIGGAELASFIENQINGKDYDFASDNVVSMLNDFTSSIGDFNQNVVVALVQGNFDLDKAKDALWGLSVDGLAFFRGFPLKNYSNIINGIFSNLSDAISGHSTYFGSSGGRKGSEYANSYDVLIDNNPEKAKQQLETFYNEKYEEQIAKGETTTEAKKKAQTSVRTALTTQYKKEYQKAFLNNDRDKMQKISKKLQKSGYMKWDGKSLSTVLGEWTKSAQEDSNK